MESILSAIFLVLAIVGAGIAIFIIGGLILTALLNSGP